MNDFFTPDVEFSTSTAFQLPLQSEHSSRNWLQAGIAAAATVAVSGLLTFYAPPTSFSDLNVDPAAVERAASRTPKYVPISAADREAASRLRASFVEVPPSDADREISPDYDL